MPAAPRHLFAVLLLCSLALLGNTCSKAGPGLEILAPRPGELFETGDVEIEIQLPATMDPGSLSVVVQGVVLTDAFTIDGDQARATLPFFPGGRQEIAVTVTVGGGAPRQAQRFFAVTDLENPDECDILNQIECLLPYPSQRFLEPADTPTGFRVAYGESTLPAVSRTQPPFGNGPLDPAPYAVNDGFSPTAQILMHFSGDTVDLEASDAPRIDPQTRSYSDRGKRFDSPTLLIRWDTGERINHFVENDDRGQEPRILTFLRPGESLVPGERYIVAARGLVGTFGEAIPPEPIFQTIRDAAPTSLEAVHERAATLEPVLDRLEELGVARKDLILAFDFTVMSDDGLTRDMLHMRDEGYAWLEAQVSAGVQTFTVEEVIERNPDCSDPEQLVWREVRGTYQVPLFTEVDPFTENDQVGFLQRGPDGLPSWSALTDAPFTIAIPCRVFDGDGLVALPPLLFGHGLFGNGRSTVEGFSQNAALGSLGFVIGATNWSGLSTPDTRPELLQSFVVKVLSNLDTIGALPDRLRQGQLQTLVLARMMKRGHFNVDPAFQDDAGRPVMSIDEPLYYFGASLGGIMGTMFAALTPDAERLNVDVPAMNFSLLLQRATPFVPFQNLLAFLVPDPMDQAIGLSLMHDLWVRGEPAGYATHVSSDPLPGSIPKRMLVTAALYDQQVSNLGSQLLARTLRVPMLEGSIQSGLPGIEDRSGPLPSAYVVYDTASFDLGVPEELPFVPPLVNRPAEGNRCDPHGRRGFIPASLEQLDTFLRPGGKIENFCTDDGICNASEAFEIPFGESERCDPLPEPEDE